MQKNSKIYVAGHKGLVGAAIVARLKAEGFLDIVVRTHQELDLTRQTETEEFFQKERPEYVFLAAAKVGGIYANSTYPADFIYQNIAIGTNVVHAAYRSGVKRLVNLGSTCIYPRDAQQPLEEACLLSAPLEKTNEAYAVAKIAVLKLCEFYNKQYGTDYISLMPTNLYGTNDNFSLNNSHVLPAMIRKMHLAKLLELGAFDQIRRDIEDDLSNAEVKKALSSYGIFADRVVLWGSGTPRREFLFADDLADAILFSITKKDIRLYGDFINVGFGEDIELKALADMIRETVGFSGEIEWDRSYADGTPRKAVECSKLQQLGWQPKIKLRDGMEIVYNAYRQRNA